MYRTKYHRLDDCRKYFLCFIIHKITSFNAYGLIYAAYQLSHGTVHAFSIQSICGFINLAAFAGCGLLDGDSPLTVEREYKAFLEGKVSLLTFPNLRFV